MPHSDIRDSKVEPAEGGKNPLTNSCWTSFSVRRSAISGELLTRSVGWRAPRQRLADLMDDAVAISGSGFGVVAILVACQRGVAPCGDGRKRKRSSARS
jgi:hypothetical protein